jgi:MerR family transcriptional regulator/heat shock protein HspR
MESQPSRRSRGPVSDSRFQRDPGRPCFVISVAASLVQAHPRTLRIYEDEGLLAPARTPTNIRLYSENDIRRILWIRRLTQERGVNLAGVRLLFELEERLGTRLLEALFAEKQAPEAENQAPEAANQAPEAESQAPEGDGSQDDRTAYQAEGGVARPSRPITRIVATRVTRTHPGDSDD